MAKGTEKFKETIKTYLDNLAIENEIFATKYKNENKNIEECIDFILNTVKKSGSNGFEDSEIYDMAVEYYNTENVNVKKGSATVIINHKVQLTEQEIEDAKKEAKEKIIAEVREEMTTKKKPTITPVEEESNQASLF